MTNKERLELNNQKIEEITRTLKNKILSISVKGKNIELPEQFATSTTVYHFVVNDDSILFSANTTGVGLWLYKINSTTWTQLTSQDYFTTFTLIGNYCLTSATGSNARGFFSYDIQNETLDKLYSGGRNWNYLTKVTDTKWIIGCGGGSTDNYGILLYNSDTNTATQIYSVGANYTHLFAIDGVCLISGSNSGAGLFLYDSKDDSINKIYEDGTFSNIIQLNNKTIFLGSSKILLYDIASRTVRLKTENWYNTMNYQKVGDNWLFSCISSNTGVWVYNYETNDLTQEYTESYYYNVFHMIGNDCLISSTNISHGVLFYNHADNTIKLLYSGNVWRRFQTVGNDCLIGDTSSASYGVLLYDSISKTITKIYTSYAYWGNFIVVGNNCLISSTNQTTTGILVYNSSTKTITKLFSSGYNWTNAQPVGNDCLIANKTSKGLLFYDATANTIKSKDSNITNVMYTLDGENCYIESEDKETYPNILYYNTVDKSFKLAKYYIGEI